MSPPLVARLELWCKQFLFLRPLLCLADTLPGLGYPLPGPVENFVFFVYFTSTTFALSSLIGFYHAFSEELKEHTPLAKVRVVGGY